MEVKKVHSHQTPQQPIVQGGLSVRTDLRAGLSLEEVQQQLGNLWGQLTNTVSGAVSNLSGGSGGTTSA